MRGWSIKMRISSRSPDPGALAALVLLCASGILAVSPSGCARRGQVPPPTTDVTVSEPQSAGKGPVEKESGVRLPGQNRYLPSEDPRNRPQAGAAPIAVIGAEPVKAAAAAPAPPSATASDVAPSTPTVDRATDSVESPTAAVEPSTGKPGAPVDPAKALLPPPVPSGEIRYRVQLFASGSTYPAFSMRDRIAQSCERPIYIEQEGGLWKVRVGDCRTRDEANALRREMIGLGYGDAFIQEVRGK